MEAPYTRSDGTVGMGYVTPNQVDAGEMYCDVEGVYGLSEIIAKQFTGFVNDHRYASPLMMDEIISYRQEDFDPFEMNTGTGLMVAHLKRAIDTARRNGTLEDDYKFATRIQKIVSAAVQTQAKVTAVGKFLSLLADSYDVTDAKLMLQLDKSGGLSRDGKLWALNNVHPVGASTEFGGLLGMIVGDQEWDHPFEGGRHNGALGVKGTLVSIKGSTTFRKPTGEKYTGTATLTLGTVTATFTPNSTHYYEEEGVTTKGEGFAFGLDVVGFEHEDIDHSTGESRKGSVSLAPPIGKAGKAGKVVSYFMNTIGGGTTYDDSTQTEEHEVCAAVFVVPVGGCYGFSNGYNLDNWQTVSERYQTRYSNKGRSPINVYHR